MSGDNVAHPAFDKPLTDDAARSYTLPARYYTDPDIIEREKEAIFYRNWSFIGHQSQFTRPGDYVCDVVIDQPVFVIRGKDGVLRGFYNVCQHRAHLLLKEGGGNRKVITCPYHAWSYHADGRLRTARNCETVPDFDKAEFSLTSWTHRPLATMLLGLAYRTGVPWNETHYASNEFDTLLTEAESTIDINERRKVMAKVEKRLQDDAIMVQPFFRAVMSAATDKIKGYKMHPTAYHQWHKVWIA